MRCNQPPAECVPGALSPRQILHSVRLAIQSLLVPRLMNFLFEKSVYSVEEFMTINPYPIKIMFMMLFTS
jgi:hypothetical protein